jgi:hypothetical protein
MNIKILEMKSRVGLEWVRNQQDTLHCGLVLVRAKFPKDMRRYMQRYMYDYVCVLDKTFARLATSWTNEQQQIYHAMLEQKQSEHYMAPHMGATTVIVGMALALALHGIAALIVVNDRREQKLCMATVDSMYSQYRASVNSAIRVTHHNVERLQFNNGGFVKCLLTGQWLRSHSWAPPFDVIFMDNLNMCKLNLGSYYIHDTNVLSIIDIDEK